MILVPGFSAKVHRATTFYTHSFDQALVEAFLMEEVSTGFYFRLHKLSKFPGISISNSLA